MNFWLLLAVFLFTAILLFVLTQNRCAHFALDKPNDRSLHTKMTPRTGGVALMAGVIVSWSILDIPIYWLGFPLALLILSLIDDVRGLPARWRFLGQSVVCVAFLMIQANSLEPLTMFFLLIALVWMVNLYNFMDGSDGLAGGMAVFGFSAYSVASYLGADEQLAMMNASIVAASLAFLLFNFHPARIFMGDAGSIPLGFLAGVIGLVGWEAGLWPAWFPILVFSPFIVDASVTLIKRLFKRESFWQAHKDHYYQRIIRMGWGHRRAAIAGYLLMLASCSSAILLLIASTWMVSLLLIVWLSAYTVLLLIIDRKWRTQ